MRRRALLAAGCVWPAAARAEPDSTVRIAIQFGIGYLPVVIADRLGLFAAQARFEQTEARLTLVRLSGATAVNDALLSGSIDVGAYGLPGMLIARERTLRNYNIRGLCSLSSLPYGLYTNVAGIRSVADIPRDARIAVTAPNTPQAELLRMAADKAFGDAHHLDTQMVSLPHPDATIGLVSGTVALYFATPPFSAVLDADPRIHRVTSSKEILGEEITGAMLATTGRFNDARHGLVRALVAALAEADALIVADPARAAALFLDSEPSKLAPAEVEALLRGMGGLYATAPSGTMAMAAFMLKQGELKTPLGRWQDAFFPPVSEGAGS